MAKRKNITEESYNGVKKIAFALEQASGKKANGSEIARITGISSTTVSRILLTEDYPAYKIYQAEMAHGKKKPVETKPDTTAQPEPAITSDQLLVHSVKLQERGVQLQESQQASALDHMATIEKIAERQAVALEALVEAWNRSGDKKKGLFS